MTADAALTLDDVRFRWPGRASFGLSVPAFRVEAGERVLLIGESGSGKSTLLSLICGIVTADAGHVQIGATDLSALRAGARDRFRAERIGVIFQQFNLLPYASVSDNILLPLRFGARCHNAGHLPGPAVRQDRRCRVLASDGQP